jgi:hypothetical protein
MQFCPLSGTLSCARYHRLEISARRSQARRRLRFALMHIKLALPLVARVICDLSTFFCLPLFVGGSRVGAKQHGNQGPALDENRKLRQEILAPALGWGDSRDSARRSGLRL